MEPGVMVLVDAVLDEWIKYMNRQGVDGDPLGVKLEDFHGEYGNIKIWSDVPYTNWFQYRHLTFYADYGEDGGGMLFFANFEASYNFEGEFQYYDLDHAVFMFDTDYTEFYNKGPVDVPKKS